MVWGSDDNIVLGKCFGKITQSCDSATKFHCLGSVKINLQKYPGLLYVLVST